jgi:arylformamidase
MRAAWIDITRPLAPGMAVWPGDPQVRLERFLDPGKGDPCTASVLSTSVHAGTHVDAPRHYLAGGAGIDEIPLSVCVGAARVMDIGLPGPLPAEVFAGRRIGPRQRILLRTGGAAVGDGSLSLGAARFLAVRGVSVVGTDGMSIGPPDEEGDEVHRALLCAGVWVIEGLDLALVWEGRCDLVCAPLRLPGADGAPARVLVRPRAPRRA